jgi:predicted RNA-binding protein
MQDVAAMEAEKDGYLLVDLFGVKKFVRGKIKCLDFVDDHTVLLEEPK